MFEDLFTINMGFVELPLLLLFKLLDNKVAFQTLGQQGKAKSSKSSTHLQDVARGARPAVATEGRV